MKKISKSKNTYDIVDFNDRIIFVGTKEDAKKKRSFTRSVHVWLFNTKEEVMICRRSSHVKSYANQNTSSAGGHVERGENYKTAAKRELKEELGIIISLKDLGRFDVITSKERAIHHLFVGKINKKVQPDPGEISGYNFISLKNLSREITLHPRKYCKPFRKAFVFYSTVTDFAKLRGRSMSRPSPTAI